MDKPKDSDSFNADVQKHIEETVDNIIDELDAGGIAPSCVRVDWTDPTKPIMKQIGQPNRELRFGVFGPGTINAYNYGRDEGIAGKDGGIRFLKGLWYNEGDWDKEYVKMPDGNYRKKAR